MRQKKCQKLQCNGRQPERTTGATEEKAEQMEKDAGYHLEDAEWVKERLQKEIRNLWRGTEKAEETLVQREKLVKAEEQKKAEQLQVEQLLHEQEKKMAEARHKRAVQEKFSVRFSGKWRKMKRENLTL